MHCPYCTSDDSKVLDSRLTEEGSCIRRRRECVLCSRRFTTYERVEEMWPVVVKKDQRRERFERRKLLSGIDKACEKRPVSPEQKEALVMAVEQDIRSRGESEISTRDLGEMVLHHLRDRDAVAYIRFASVYREFEDLDSFLRELKRIEAEGPRAT
ncbi:MAG TPA: transcriptional regulator NrdR [Candidatus Xenobia bacterium]